MKTLHPLFTNHIRRNNVAHTAVMHAGARHSRIDRHYNRLTRANQVYWTNEHGTSPLPPYSRNGAVLVGVRGNIATVHVL